MPTIKRRCCQPQTIAAAIFAFFTVFVWLPPKVTAQVPSAVEVVRTAEGFALATKELGNFYATTQEIRDTHLIAMPPSRAWLALWHQKQSDGSMVPYYAISRDGSRIARTQKASYEILLRYDRFDPLVRQPSLPRLVAVKGAHTDTVYIVQFVSQPIEEFRAQISALGGTIYKFLANNAYLVRMSSMVRDQVARLTYVRWIGPYHPAYRLEDFLLAKLGDTGFDLPRMRYNIQVFERGTSQQDRVAQRVRALGGSVESTTPQGFRLEATLDAGALLEVLQMNEVQFIDRWSPPETDVTTARQIGGADYVESVAEFTGAGVRGEVMDIGVRSTHVDFQSRPLLIHGTTPPIHNHGTGTTGIVFGDGTGDIRGRGLLPAGQGIVADTSEASNRYQHTAQLLDNPYSAVFQTNSWGDRMLTEQYTTISAEMDDILFLNDILITQSQSNAGTQMSRPQAWAKNIVSVGGLLHRGSLDMDTHCWCGRASIGPAADGRIKPDLAHFYDKNFTASGGSDTDYTRGFGGTSAATPIVAGYFGLFFEMWYNGIFGNPTGNTVFDSRPHMSTARAMMINTARQWNFSGMDHDRTRVHQGWGFPDLRYMYDMSDNIFVVDQTDVLQNLDSTVYSLSVASSARPLKATLVYTDLMGTTPSSQHRINKLNLKVTSPSQVIYWGNNGLMSGMWSEPGGDPDTKNTVENVFIQTPEPGTWTVEVIGAEIVEDEHLATAEVDSDYALVVSGVTPQ